MFTIAYMGQTGWGAARPKILLRGKETGARATAVARGVKTFEESVFGPCTLGRTWGTRPGKRASFFRLVGVVAHARQHSTHVGEAADDAGHWVVAVNFVFQIDEAIVFHSDQRLENLPHGH
jgi:hypothetical protein